MEPTGNQEGYPPQRFPPTQANGTVPPRPSSHIRQLVDPYAANNVGGPPPPAYQDHLISPMGNGSAGGASLSHSRENRDFRDRERESGGDFQVPPVQPPHPPRSNPRDRGDFTGSSSHTSSSSSSSKDLKRGVSLEGVQPKILKIAVIGNPTAGKTCICQAVTQDRYNFNRNYQLTCGVGVYSKGIKLPEEKDEQVNMVLMDSSGKDVYKEALPKYWGKLDGVVLVVDVSSGPSLQNAGQWLSLAQKCMKASGAPGDGPSLKLTGILMANKMDIPPERRVVSSSQVEEFAVNNHLEYFECSVKDNSGLEEPFHFLAQMWVAGTLGLTRMGGSTSRNEDKENNVDSA